MSEGSARASDEHDRAHHHRAERDRKAADQVAAERSASLNSRPAPANPGKILGDPRMRGRGNSSAQADLLTQMQQTYGNRATQRLLQRQRSSRSPAATLAPAGPVQLKPAAGASPAPALPAAASATEWLVDDSVESLLPGQMNKSAFLAQVRGAVKAAASQATADGGANSQIDDILHAYGARDSRSLEQEIRRSVPGASSATGASSYVYLIAGQVRRSVAQQASTPDASGGPGSGMMRAAGGLLGGIGRLFFKARDAGPKDAANPAAINSRLGPGQPLDGAVGSGMEAAFGQSFSGVRVHTDPEAAALSDDLNARAFTVGQNIAFGTGEYRPGTPIGDALIAHELAHVVQQAGAPAGGLQAKDGGETSALEEDADTAAVRAVLGVKGGFLGGLARISQEAMPRLRSGLRLQRCSKKEEQEEASADIDKFAGMIGNPDENAAALEAALDEGSPRMVATALASRKSLNKEERLRALAGTEGGRRVLRAMAKVLDRGDGDALTMSGVIANILNEYDEQVKTPKEATLPEHDVELERLNKVIPAGDYSASEVDYPPGETTRIVPLSFPITLKPDVPQMGGIYYNPYFSTKETAHAAKTVSEDWEEGGTVQIPLAYIEIGPRVLFYSTGEDVDRTRPRDDAYIKTVMFHEFHHYKQIFARRGGPADPEKLRAGDRPSDSEIEALGLQIARDAVDPALSEKDLSGLLHYMAENMADSQADFRNAAVGRIVAGVAGNVEAQRKLISIIDTLIANEKKEIAAAKKADKNTAHPEIMPTLKDLRDQLQALLPPGKQKKGKRKG